MQAGYSAFSLEFKTASAMETRATYSIPISTDSCSSGLTESMVQVPTDHMAPDKGRFMYAIVAALMTPFVLSRLPCGAVIMAAGRQ
jgi:hypothetical protein